MSEVNAHTEEDRSCDENSEQKYFKIAEASDLLGVKPHVLRYWESEFPQIRPYKSKSGQRLYRRRDFEALKHVQRLLYQERCTIASARQALRQFFEKETPEMDANPSGEPANIAVEIALPFEKSRPTIQHESEEKLHHEVVKVQPAQNESSSHSCKTSKPDVLEIVEEKVAKSEIRESLWLARSQLEDIIAVLAAC